MALIEKEPWLGGASANTGTLPSKTLRETALFLSGFRNRALYGLQFTLKQQVNVRDFMARERYICDTERARIQANLKRHRVRVYSGTASFVDPHVVAIKPTGSPEIQVRGEKILIATGSSPYRPPIFPFHDPRVLDSDTVLTLRDMPGSMLVCGGGVIGCEYACMFAALGVKVTPDRGRRDRVLRLPRPRDLRGAPQGDGGDGHPDAHERRGGLGPERAGHRPPPQVRRRRRRRRRAGLLGPEQQHGRAGAGGDRDRAGQARASCRSTSITRPSSPTSTGPAT